ncbi:hypothetical protein VP01_596g4 [Puccinia sorghi]|uniref:Uncharacterized protein n=1 Tax=Puccinia sorghi TaxID=27349 RepID=A0A0L6UHJ3_9BASI|nr:hypothetical protein VP01_596g4 [Puccinia sorghi]
MSKTALQTQPTPGPSNTLAAAKKHGRSPKKPGAPVVSGKGSMNSALGQSAEQVFLHSFLKQGGWIGTSPHHSFDWGQCVPFLYGRTKRGHVALDRALLRVSTVFYGRTTRWTSEHVLMWVGTHGELALGNRYAPHFPMGSNSLPKLFPLTQSNLLCNIMDDSTMLELGSCKNELCVQTWESDDHIILRRSIYEIHILTVVLTKARFWTALSLSTSINTTQSLDFRPLLPTTPHLIHFLQHQIHSQSLCQKFQIPRPQPITMPQLLLLVSYFVHYCSRPILTCSPDFLAQDIHDKNSSNEFAMCDKITGQPAPLKPETSILNSNPSNDLQQKLSIPNKVSVNFHSSNPISTIASDHLSSHSLGRNRCHPGFHPPLPDLLAPANLLEEDSQINPGQDVNTEVSNSQNQTSPSTGNHQVQSSTKNPGSNQNSNDQSSSSVQKEPVQTQAPTSSSNPPTDATIDKTVTASNDSQVPNTNSNPPDTLSSTTRQTSGNPPPEPANQPDLSNQAEPSEPPNPNTSGDTDHQPTSGNDNKTQKDSGPQPAPQPPNAIQSSIPTNTNLTIMPNLDAQIEIISMQQNENKTKANWQNFRLSR